MTKSTCCGAEVKEITTRHFMIFYARYECTKCDKPCEVKKGVEYLCNGADLRAPK